MTKQRVPGKQERACHNARREKKGVVMGNRQEEKMNVIDTRIRFIIQKK